VIIVAAGRSERMAADVPKPLLDLGGRTILQHSVSAFDRHPAVSEIVVVLPSELVASAASLVGATRVSCRCVAGGAQRHDSVRAGFASLPAGVDVVLIHDAARPFADAALIDRVLDATRDAGAVVPAMPARDTVKRVDEHGQVAATIPRSEVWLAQTPQGFRRDVLERAMREGDARHATDEAVLVEQSGQVVRVVEGNQGNVKITTQDDLAAARARVAAAPRVGTGYDLHRLGEGRRLVLAGVVLPFEKGPIGHSDGDVVCHSLVDAILGAAGAGDIGQHFPNTDPAWKDAAGLDLLARSIAIVAKAGFLVASADITVILERPKLVPHVGAIRDAIAGVLGIPSSHVSVKGKTNEGVDATGRGEAIAAHAVAVLVAGGAR
jgi:2-C-methyl-D-erythritol 4-phosphate cytidylyltransferase/2-C-methyl-D-erythritol 2,4-cyclodiphosphate synthase